jgi:hypothetical protein
VPCSKRFDQNWGAGSNAEISAVRLNTKLHPLFRLQFGNNHDRDTETQTRDRNRSGARHVFLAIVARSRHNHNLPVLALARTNVKKNFKRLEQGKFNFCAPGPLSQAPACFSGIYHKQFMYFPASAMTECEGGLQWIPGNQFW